MPLPPTFIETPLQRLAVRTAAEYRAKQAKLLAANRRARPELQWPEPWASTPGVSAYIGAGAWRVLCACGEAPPADPTWRLACCSGCGAVYEEVAFPDDRAAIEAVLVNRPRPTSRNWRRPETLEHLVAENIAHGDPV